MAKTLIWLNICVPFWLNSVVLADAGFSDIANTESHWLVPDKIIILHHGESEDRNHYSIAIGHKTAFREWFDEAYPEVILESNEIDFVTEAAVEGTVVYARDQDGTIWRADGNARNIKKIDGFPPALRGNDPATLFYAGPKVVGWSPNWTAVKFCVLGFFAVALVALIWLVRRAFRPNLRRDGGYRSTI